MSRLPRFIAFFSAAILLIHGILAGLTRSGWNPITNSQSYSSIHGQLMVCGFLGTVISLERTVALKQFWCWFAPGFIALGMLYSIFGNSTLLGFIFLALGSFVYLAIQVLLFKKQTNYANLIILIGAILWVASNLLLINGRQANEIVLFWVTFLMFTIIGERIELSSLLKTNPKFLWLSRISLSIMFVSTFVSLYNYAISFKLYGIALLLVFVWATKQDMAFRNYKLPSISGYTARSLVLAWFWSLIAGMLFLVLGGVPQGPIYDALLHSIFLGYVFSMVFGHGPIIFPSVLNLRIPFSPILYIPLALLHLTLLLRVIGDIVGIWELKKYATMGTAASIPIFLVLMLSLILKGLRK